MIKISTSQIEFKSPYKDDGIDMYMKRWYIEEKDLSKDNSFVVFKEEWLQKYLYINVVGFILINLLCLKKMAIVVQ